MDIIPYLSTLNNEQLEIATDSRFKDEQLGTCIIACAGSGKTKTLISKIAFMILKLKCLPEYFFITTFTKNAASELIERLSDYLDEDVILKMTIGTFHSIAYQTFQSIDEESYLEEHIESYLHRYYEMLQEYGSTYKYIFIDEYQDINEIQENIIRLLSSYADLTITVGDDQQNIYTFRKTDIKYILSFTENYTNSEYKYLVKNYRCNSCIVKLANIVLEHNTNKIDKTIIALNTSKAKHVNLVSFNNQKNQITQLISLLLTIHSKKSKDLHKIAIIARNHFILKTLEYELTMNGIPTYYIEPNENSLITNEKIQHVTQRIILSTIHGTKGLEFDEQYLIDVNDGTFPSAFTNDIEEERRLFYVGITRAKNKLTICYDGRRPSMFIQEILNHPDADDCIIQKSSYNGNLITFKPKVKMSEIKDYSIDNIIQRMDFRDFDDFSSNIYDYRTENVDDILLHDPLPDYFTEFCQNRQLLVANISNIFCDFIETYVNRTVQHISNSEIENLDYTIHALYHFKEGIEQIKNRKDNGIVDDKFKTNLCGKSDDELLSLIRYYQSGLKSMTYINNDYIPYFVKAYQNYTSNKPSSIIIFDIFIISLIKGIVRGRNSILHLINFQGDRYFYKQKINKTDITEYKPWLKSIEQSLMRYYSKIKNIKMSYTVVDTETLVKTVFDMIYDDTVIIIKPVLNKPHIKTFLEAISNLSLARRQKFNINKCGIYNPISGKLYLWNLEGWEIENDVIYFLTERFQ